MMLFIWIGCLNDSFISDAHPSESFIQKECFYRLLKRIAKTPILKMGGL